MENIQLTLDEKGFGHFYIFDEGEQLGEMEISISGSNLTAYHTGVSEKAEGKGYAKKLLREMVSHARKHKLKVIPLCPFVHAQFKRHPAEYADVWNNNK
jgi:predicted GNAT family acetyltransferase